MSRNIQKLPEDYHYQKALALLTPEQRNNVLNPTNTNSYSNLVIESKSSYGYGYTPYYLNYAGTTSVPLDGTTDGSIFRNK
jgi:hypothetical protein